MAHPYAELARAGFEVDFASIKGGKPPIEPPSIPSNPHGWAAVLWAGLPEHGVDTRLQNDQISMDFLNSSEIQVLALALDSRVAEVSAAEKVQQHNTVPEYRCQSVRCSNLRGRHRSWYS